jgi:hypothetical protein
MSGCCAGLAGDKLEACEKFKTQSTNDLYKTLNNTAEDMYPTLVQCLQDRITDGDEPLLKLLNSYESKKKDAVTASELNKNTMTLYQIDLYYTIGKIFMFLIILLAYYYFLNGQNMVSTIQTGIQTANEKLTKFTEAKPPKMPIK